MYQKRENNLEDLSRNELLQLMRSYNDYIQHYQEEHDIGMTPVSLYEYFDNEYQEDNNNYCIECGCEKEDYESMYCDECWEKESERLHENTNDEEYIEPLMGINVIGNSNGVTLKFMGVSEELYSFDIVLDINENKMNELYENMKTLVENLKVLYNDKNGVVLHEDIVQEVQKINFEF